MRAATLVLLLALPVAIAGPAVVTYRETFDSLDPNIWFVEGDGGIDCAVGNRGCSLYLAGFSHAEGALPALASPVGVFSIDVLRTGAGAGESTIELTLERGYVAATIAPSGLSLFSSSDPGETSDAVIAPGSWHRLEVQLAPLAATLRLVDAQGATLATLGPVALPPSAGAVRTIGLTGNGIADAHHFDNVVLAIRA